jgi:hypothetical protein
MLSFRVAGELVRRLEKVTDRTKNPYAPNTTQILERGLMLALDEIERKKRKK